ncbi:hypothetical protein NEOLEDRAFT_1060838 [Neolentinus lepideus HHB14362 ss-1]|uniref:PH domain-containing protein n=1 Tax=Neolentinus lepideus HHB14362 ss-1 TaxID=1314782 RepID=A0A165TYN6_9AGAM|nr:hypothetical protein NEOLEDRAFT_1060838 [Neolentinus lepideus HHB14362 ss-1]
MSRPRAAPPSDLPPPPPVPPVLRQNLQLVQQRVFVGDLQRFHTVEIGPATVAEDVVKMVASQGGLEDLVGSGGWMLWEVAQDFGMDRPIRGFELLQDVFASWNKDKMVNTLMIKRTLLEQILRRSALPSASPICRGYVEYEVKRGKWNKRWLELREHSLYLAKRDNGKDETFLCSLSNFDAYHVTRLHKAPKPYTFAVKSTDNLSFFENTADYVHIFSVPEKEGQMWMEKILLARSYMLIQERTVLMAKSGGLNGTAGSKGLARAPTRKQPPRANQTLVAAPSPAVFEPGSLLAKR